MMSRAFDILLLTATDKEQQDIREMIRPSRQECVAGRAWTCGVWMDRRVLLVETGVGSVNTAHALTAAIERHIPSLVFQFGIGGAYPASGLQVGDLAVATEEIYGDLGVLTPDGWAGMDAIGFPVLKKEAPYYNRFALDPALADAAQTRLAALPWDDPAPAIARGPFVTVNQCSGTTEAGSALTARFGGLCENMEGAAAAHVCALYGAPFLEIRCMSNRVEDRDMAAWNIPLAMRRAQTAAKRVLEFLKGQ
jgi:futalosine hydrolase